MSTLTENGMQMTLEMLMPGIYRKPIAGHLGQPVLQRAL